MREQEPIHRHPGTGIFEAALPTPTNLAVHEPCQTKGSGMLHDSASRSSTTLTDGAVCRLFFLWLPICVCVRTVLFADRRGFFQGMYGKRTCWRGRHVWSGTEEFPQCFDVLLLLYRSSGADRSPVSFPASSLPGGIKETCDDAENTWCKWCLPWILYRKLT